MIRRRNVNIIMLLIIIFLISIGYSYLNTNVSINGISSIASSQWNVYWNNVQVMNGSVEANTPTIINQSTVNFDIFLSKPGDYYEFTVDAKNDGTIDAMIANITKTINNNTTIPNYLNYEVTYVDGVEILQNHILATNTFETIKVRVEFKKDIEPEDLPTNPETLNISFGINYIQEDGNSIPVRETIYTISNIETNIGSTMPDITKYNNYQDAISNFGKPVFLKHIIANGKVISTYIGFTMNNNVYYIRGGVYESGKDDNDPTPIYEENIGIMENAFGTENCGDWSWNNYRNYTCRVTNLSVYSATDGYIEAGPGDCYCYVHVGGASACECS